MNLLSNLILYTGYWSFEKFAGYTFFIFMALCGFWCLTFILCIIPYWLFLGIPENRGKINRNKNVKRKILSEQEGVQLLYKIDR